MAEIIAKYREQQAKNAGAAFGLKHGQPTITAGDQQIQPAEHADVWALPVDNSEWQPLQDLDPNSGTFGYTFGLWYYDYWDDPTKIWG